MAMKVLWAAVLLAYGASTGAAMGNVASFFPKKYKLDMALKSVDDMYEGCEDKMAEKVEKEYLPDERNIHGDFKEAWDDAVKVYDGKHKKKIGRRPNTNGPTLTREQSIAVYVYTSVGGDIYEPFNDAVRNKRDNNFSFHALHFYLTIAVKNLNKRQLESRQGECFTVSRRTTVSFHEVKVNTEVRLGSFASSSLMNLREPKFNIERFGDKTCFEIETCMGADVSMFSKYENEAEVLIPPYEVFNVTDKKKRSKFPNCFPCEKKYPDLPCDVVYTLKSTNVPVSNFNCALFKKSTKGI